MLDPIPLLAADYFATRDVTLPRLQKYSVDVILRLGLDNPGGVFTSLVTDLTVCTPTYLARTRRPPPMPALHTARTLPCASPMP